MKIEKVVYLTQTPFTKRDAERFGVNIFKHYNLDVVVLDVTPYLDKHVSKNYVLNENESFDYVVELGDYDQIKEFILQTSQNTIFISFIGESSIKALKLLDLLFKYEKIFGIIFSGSLPQSSRNSILTRFKLLTPKSILRIVCKAIYMVLIKKYCFSFVIVSGKKSLTYTEKKYSQSRIVYGHAFDYDLYLETQLKSTKKSTKKKYALFLDEFFPFHPDYMRQGIDYSGFADSYYNKLNRLFEYIEKSFELEIIIAAHPRSYYDRLPNYWNSREYKMGNTIELVKDAQLCITHASTSINFAVLYNKPIVSVSMNEIKETNVQHLLKTMHEELDTTYVNLDDDVLKFNNVHINKEKYDRYKKNYIKLPDTEDLNNWKILYKYYTTKA